MPSQRATSITSLLRLLSVGVQLCLHLLVALPVVVALLLYVPPNDLLRRAGIVIVRSALDYPAIDLDRLNLVPPRRITIAGLYVGGLGHRSKPLFTLDSIDLELDPDRLQQGEVRLKTITALRPQIWLEQQGKHFNWQPWIDRFASDEATRDEHQLPSSSVDAKETASSTFIIEQLAIRDIGAWVSLDHSEMAIRNVDLTGHVTIDADKNALELNMQQHSAEQRRLNIAFHQRQSPPVTARWFSDLSLDLTTQNIDPWRGATSIRWTLTPSTSEALMINDDLPVQVPTVNLVVDIATDIARQIIQCKTARLTIDRQTVLATSAQISDLGGSNQIAIEQGELHLPLDLLAPYINLFMPELRVGGDIRARKIRVTTATIDLQQGALPKAKSKISLRNVRFAMAGQPWAVDGVTGNFDIATQSGTEPKWHHITVNGGLTARQVAWRQETLSDLSWHLSTAIAANWSRGDVNISRLTTTIDRRTTIKLSGTMEDFGQQKIALQFVIPKTEIKPVLQRLPASIRDRLPMTVSQGRISLSGDIRGRIPPRFAFDTVNQLFASPLAGNLNIAVSDASIKLPPQRIAVTAVDVTLALAKRRRAVTIDGNMMAQHVTDAANGFDIDNATSAWHTVLRPNQITATLDVAAAKIRQRVSQQIYACTQCRVEQQITMTAPLQALITGRETAIDALHGQSRVHLSEVRFGDKIARSMTEISAINLALDLDYVLPGSAQAAPLTMALTGDVGHVADPQRRFSANNLQFNLHQRLTRGLQLNVPTLQFFPRRLASDMELEVSVGELHITDHLPEPLIDSTFATRLTLNRGDALNIERLALTVPSLATDVNLDGQIGSIAALQSGPLPHLNLNFSGQIEHLKNRTAIEKLLPGLDVSGRSQVNIAIARVAEDQLRLVGEAIAEQLRIAYERRLSRADGTTQHIELQLDSLDGRVPFRQTFRVDKQSRRAIFAVPDALGTQKDRRMLYSYVRPFIGKQATLKLNGIAFVDTLYRGEETISKRQFDIDAAGFDLSWGEGTLAVDRFFIELFGGDIAGALHVSTYDEAGPNLRIDLDTRVTNMDVGYIDAAQRIDGKKALVSGLLDISYLARQRDLSGHALITDISLHTLDSFLLALDPYGEDATIQANRDVLAAWYTRWVNPHITEVALNIKHSMLNIDIDLEAWEPMGSLLRRILSQSRIRRVSLKGFFPRLIAMDMQE